MKIRYFTTVKRSRHRSYTLVRSIPGGSTPHENRVPSDVSPTAGGIVKNRYPSGSVPTPVPHSPDNSRGKFRPVVVTTDSYLSPVSDPLVVVRVPETTTHCKYTLRRRENKV